MEEYEKALELFEKSLQLKKNWTSDKPAIARTYNNLGELNCTLALQYFNKGISSFTKSINIKKELGDKKGLTVSHFALADLYAELGMKRKGKNHFKQFLNLGGREKPWISNEYHKKHVERVKKKLYG